MRKEVGRSGSALYRRRCAPAMRMSGHGLFGPALHRPMCYCRFIQRPRLAYSLTRSDWPPAIALPCIYCATARSHLPAPGQRTYPCYKATEFKPASYTISARVQDCGEVADSSGNDECQSWAAAARSTQHRQIILQVIKLPATTTNVRL